MGDLLRPDIFCLKVPISVEREGNDQGTINRKRGEGFREERSLLKKIWAP